MHINGVLCHLKLEYVLVFAQSYSGASFCLGDTFTWGGGCSRASGTYSLCTGGLQPATPEPTVAQYGNKYGSLKKKMKYFTVYQKAGRSNTQHVKGMAGKDVDGDKAVFRDALQKRK